ncbi:MAG TPA: hypothetical protein VM261_38150 [Kofleriaceae bacterium]|nr:hypothetical protein [Kofleriaceae bacterium]
MTRVDLKGQRPDEATETRDMAEQARREQEHEHNADVAFGNKTFVVLLIVMVVLFAGIAVAVRL